MLERLSPIQLEALEHVKNKSKELSHNSKTSAENILLRANINSSIIEKVIEHIQNNAQVLIHFHPDRIILNGQTVAESLLQKGNYLTQFETGISNGGLSAFHGGQRDEWEKGLFGGVYQKSETNITERPKYGALDLMCFSDGSAPRFGSCYFRLNKEVSKRCSFTNRDSYYEPKIFDTIDNFINIFSSLLDEAETNNKVLGIESLTVSTLIDKLLSISTQKVNYSSNYGRALNEYIEAQIHGPIDLNTDVETLVIDPSFQSTSTGITLELICKKYDIELDYHGGFKIHTSKIPDDFRGIETVNLAKKIAVNDFINTAMIGEASISLINNPEEWKDYGTYDEVLQYIKYLWHVLSYYGEPLNI